MTITITHTPKPGNEYRAQQRRTRNANKNSHKFIPNLITHSHTRENLRRLKQIKTGVLIP